MTSTDMVAVFNSSPDTVEMLRFVLQQAGLVVASAFTFELRDGKVDLITFMTQHAPSVVLYDVAPPYDANWALFERLRSNPVMAQCEFVVLSANAGHVQNLPGVDTPVFEVVGKSRDLDAIVSATRDALQRRRSKAS